MPNPDLRAPRTLKDPETGLHSRASLRLEVERMSASAARYGFPLGLITVSFPQSAAPLMPQLGRFLAQGIRSADCLARTGPCELQMLLSHEDVEHAPRVMERLRALVADYRHRSGAGADADPILSLDTELDVASFTHALAV